MALTWAFFGLLNIAILFQAPQGENLVFSIFSHQRPFVLQLLQYWSTAGMIAGIWAYMVWNGMRLQYQQENLKMGHAGCFGLQTLVFGGSVATQYYTSLPLPEDIVLQAWYWRALLGAFGLAYTTSFTLNRLYASAEDDAPYNRCPVCSGKGWVHSGPAYFIQRGPCPSCKGAGVIEPGAGIFPSAAWPSPDFQSAPPVSATDVQRERNNYQGVLAAQAGDFEQAEAIFSTLCDRHPNWASPKLNLANVLVELKNFRRAEELLWEARDLCETENDHVNVLVGLGNTFFHRRCYRRALDFFIQALKRGGEASDIRFNMGLCWYYLGYVKEAGKNLDLTHAIRNEQKLRQVRYDLDQFDYADADAQRIIEQLRNRAMPIFTHPDENRKHRFSKAINELDNFVEQHRRSVVFFAGAGISLNAPSNLPVASRFLRDLFELLYSLDRTEITAILKDKAGLHFTDTEDAYKGIIQYIFGKEHDLFPFEPTFQRLESIAGPPVLSFVEILREGAPNYHHFMLAAAIAQGYTVVTTNFDDRIEQAYSVLFPDNKIQTVVTDFEFQQWLDQPLRDGCLLKIHGSLENYGSLALTAQGIWATSEFSMRIGDDIDPQKAEKQRALSHDESSLSIPKDLVLSRIMDESTTVFMGYSGSDIHDISPVVFSNLAERRVVWLAHEADPEKLPAAIRSWLADKSISNKPLIVKPEHSEDNRDDITHAVSAHWKLRLLNHPEPFPMSAAEPVSLSYQAFCDWLERMSFRKGDGLAFLAEFFENNGHFDLALACYEGACRRYADTLPAGKKERRLVHTEYRVPFCLAYTGRTDEADEQQLAFIRRLENNRLEEHFIDVYVSALLEAAGRLVRSGRMAEGKKLWQKGERIAEKHRLLHGQVFAESVQGAILYREGKVSQALEHFLNALNGCSIIGIAYGEARAAIEAAHCFKDLGSRFEAYRLSGLAHQAAKKSGDLVLQKQIEHDRQIIRNYYEYNHMISRQAEVWESVFSGLLTRIGISYTRFRYLLANRDEKALNELFLHLKQLSGLNAEQTSAIIWYNISAALETGKKDAAEDLLQSLTTSVGPLPLVELELFNLRHGYDDEIQDKYLAYSYSLEMARLRLLETRPAILRAKFELETALENLCQRREIDYGELMALFEQLKVERAEVLLEKLKEALPPRPDSGGMSVHEATILWHKSLLHRRKSNETRQELALLEKLIEAFPDNILYQYNAGVAALNVERFEAAEQYLNAAYNLSGNDYPLALCSLGLLYVRRGDKARSRECWKRLEAEGASQHSLDMLSRQIQ